MPQLTRTRPLSAARRPLHTYRVFGGVLASALSFPNLRPVSGMAADWTLRRAMGPAPDGEFSDVGVDRLTDSVSARLGRDASRYRLAFDDTGTFDVAREGREITWYPPDGVEEDLARIDVVGRILALAAHAAGVHCLHASAIVAGSRAIAFAAPKGYGKSTLAMAAVAHGARLLTDDTLPIALSDGVTATPGVHGVRLRDDTASQLASGRGVAPSRDLDKLLIAGFADSEIADAAVPLDAIYLLDPRQPDAGSRIVTRRRLTAMEGTLALVAHGSLANLLGRDDAARALVRATTIASTVPVFALQIGRELARIGEVVATILTWHGMPSPSGSDQPARAAPAPVP